MSRDVRELLHDTAVAPASRPDVTGLVRRGRRRRHLRRGAVTLVASAALVAVALIGGQAVTGPTPPQIIDQPTATDDATASPSPTSDASDVGEPSQTPEAAARDGVLPAVAALTFDQRVEVVEPVQDGLIVQSATDEGVWVVSRLSAEADQAAVGCGLGATDDPDAVYRRDVICTMEYGEVLLLNDARDEILRAFPLPGVPPQRLEVSEDAVWCGRAGDGGLPDGMLCRIDRQTFDWHVRVFPSRVDSGSSDAGDAGSGVDPATGKVWLPDNWTLDDGPVRFSQDYLAGTWDIANGALVATARDTLRYDPATLAPVPPCRIDVSTETIPDGNDVRLTTTIAKYDGDPCQLGMRTHHELYGTDGWPLETTTPAPHQLPDTIVPDDRVQFTSVWSNWCGGPEPDEVVIDLGRYGQWSSPLPIVPACLNDGNVSQLDVAASNDRPRGEILTRPTAGDRAPAQSDTPAAGICAGPAATVTITLPPDRVPMPRCAKVTRDSILRVVNDTSGGGRYPSQAATVEWSLAGWTLRLDPGEAVELDMPAGDYLQPKVHFATARSGDQDTSGGSVWLVDDTTP